MKTPHAVWDTKANALLCKHCGGRHPLPLPMDLSMAAKKAKAFGMLHQDCKPKAVKS